MVTLSSLHAEPEINISLSDILGNAYLSLYFNTGQNPKISQQALSAYSQAVSIYGHPGWICRGSNRGQNVVECSLWHFSQQHGECLLASDECSFVKPVLQR